MAGEVERLYILFDADGRPYARGLRDIENETNRSARTVSDRWDRAGKQIVTGLKWASVAAAAAIAAIGVASVKAAASFEYEMSRIRANADGTAAELQQLEGVVLQLGKDTVFSAAESAQAANELVKAGLDVGQTMAALPGMLDLAAAGELGVAQAATITAQALNAFGLEAKDATWVADVLAATANKSTTEVANLGQGLATGASIAQQANMSFADFNAVLGIMSNNGVEAAEAGTMLKTMFTQIMAPTAQQAQLMEDLGFSIYDATGKVKPMVEIIRNLETSLEGATEEERNFTLATLFGTRGIVIANTLLKETSAGYAQWTEAVSQAGFAQDVATTKLDNLRGSITMLKGSLETLMISMGGEMLAPVRAMVDGLVVETNRFIETWDRLTGTDTWQQGGFEVKFDLATDTILDALTGLMRKAGEAIEDIDWASVGQTIGEAALTLLEVGLEQLVTNIIPAIWELASGLIASPFTWLHEFVQEGREEFQRSDWARIQGYYTPTAADRASATAAWGQTNISGALSRVMTQLSAKQRVSGWWGELQSFVQAGYASQMAEQAEQAAQALAEEEAAAELLQERMDALRATYESVVAPADAWNETLLESKTAAEGAGAAWDESMASLEDYLAKLDEQLAAWADYQANLQGIADVFGPGLVAQFDEATAYAIIDSAAALGPGFIAELAANMDTPEGVAMVEEALINTYRAGIQGAEGSLPTITITPEIDYGADWYSGIQEQWAGFSFAGTDASSYQAAIDEALASLDLTGEGSELGARVVGAYSSTVSDPGSGLGAVTRDALPTDLTGEAGIAAGSFTGGWRVILSSPSGGLAASARSAANVNLYSQGYSGGQSFVRGLRAALGSFNPSVNVGVRSSGGGTFDRGGMLPPGVHLVGNFTGRPEPILTPTMGDDLRMLVQTLKLSMDTAGPSSVVNVDTAGMISEMRHLGDRVEKALSDVEWQRQLSERTRRH